MKFTKFGKTLLMSALSVGVILSVTSCVQSYGVGYLYVTGTVTSGSSSDGYITGFVIDHNTGKLTPVHGLNPPISSGGANPVRAVLIDASRYIYVLNRGVSSNPAGTNICTFQYPCTGSNITQFAVGANGILTAQETFDTQGTNPFRMFADSSGSFIYVLEHDSPDNFLPSGTPAIANGCAQALTGATTCGDITVFSVNQTTGRLSLIVNDQVKVTTTGGTQNITYFPVPANPVDFVLSGSTVFTMSSAHTAFNATTGAYTGGSSVLPYTYNSSNGQLLANNQTISQSLNLAQGTAIASAGSYVYVLDNEPISVGGSVVSQSQIVPWSPANGVLSATTSGPIPDDATLDNPIVMALETRGKWFYVANDGNNVINTGTTGDGLAGYVINSPYDPIEMAATPTSFGGGSGPQCMVEDPSNQFFYEANFVDSTVTGQAIDENAGYLIPLSQSTKVPSSYTLAGPPTWCLVDGRTN